MPIAFAGLLRKARFPSVKHQYSYDTPFYVGTKLKNERIGTVHMHPGVELGSVPRGEGRIYVDGTFYPLRQGDCIFIDGMIPHGVETESTEPFENLHVHLSTESVIHASPREGDLRLLEPFVATQAGVVPVISGADRVFALLHDALEAYLSGSELSELSAWSIVTCALVELRRVVMPEIEKIRDEGWLKTNEIVTKAVSYIRGRFGEPLSLEDIARNCSCSVSHLSHVFSRHMGSSPIEYRNRIRIAHAVRRLASSDAKIERIAFDCGFESYSQFRQLFKRMTGQTPGAFQKKARSQQPSAQSR
ncbi:MAG: helix-turn-helix domain-containing protein [Chitinivibrionales bacterium]|nr:helix-turn-helix domain-containing protein [Chitinivibrionales bacterium]MBD3395216.1 helix-turn-helix domain-containing protein [Chitinivibrionales bacterium]